MALNGETQGSNDQHSCESGATSGRMGSSAKQLPTQSSRVTTPNGHASRCRAADKSRAADKINDKSNDEQPSLEEQVTMLREQLNQAQKLTALGELVSTTTHEFNNVLMTILNYAKIGMRHKDDPTRDKAFEKILGAANRAAKITNGVLGFARNRSDAFEATDLEKIVDDAMVLLEREMSKYRISVEKQFENVPQVLVNGNQIQQVLLNLLINARQAMPDGGQIILRATHDASAGTVDLMVRDSGCGMPPEQLRQIFDRFFSTKKGPDASGKGGTGLGLAMCRDIIEGHRGRIRVESSVGKGTAFTLKLPVAVEKSPADTSSSVPTLGIPVDNRGDVQAS